MSRLAIYITVLSLTLSACATNKSQPTGNKSVFDTAREREAVQLKHYPLSIDNKSLVADVLAASKPTVENLEEYYYVSIPISTQQPVECLVYKDDIDPASSLKNIMTEMLAELPQNRILDVDAGTFQHMPYLSQESLYITNKMAGTLKGMVIAESPAPIICFHDEVGYRETFKKTASSLATSLKISGVGANQWQYSEVAIWQIKDMRVGFTVNQIAKHDKGDATSYTFTSMIIPRSESESMSMDSYDVTHENSSGLLLEGIYVDVENGEIQHSIELTRANDGSYRAKGEFQGKKINSVVSKNMKLAGTYHQTRALIKAAQSKVADIRSLSFDSYAPSANPVKPMKVVLKPTGNTVEQMPEYDLNFSGINATGTVDRHGVNRMTLLMGPIEMKVSRVYSQGSH